MSLTRRRVLELPTTKCSTKVGQLLHGALEEQQEQEGGCRPASTEP